MTSIKLNKFSSKQIVINGILLIISVFFIISSQYSKSEVNIADEQNTQNSDSFFRSSDLAFVINNVNTAEILSAEIINLPEQSVSPTVSPTPTKIKVSPTFTKIPTIIPTKAFTPTPTKVISSSCVISTQNCVPCTIGGSSSTCRARQYQTNGYLGVSCQNNNPGNIRPANFKNTIIVNNGGVAPCGSATMVNNSNNVMGDYMTFKTYADGMSALKAYVTGISKGQHPSYPACGNCTLSNFFSIYSPGSTTYATYVGAAIGVDPTTTTLSWVVVNKLDGFVNAIKTHEGWFTQ